MIYQIRVKGHLDNKWSDWFGGMTISLEEDEETLLTGPVVDQSALHGLLKQIRDLGMPLISVNRIERQENKMKAIVYTKYGSPDVLKLKEVEKPVPKDNEILVKVFASSVTSGVTFIRKGQHPDSKLFTLILRLMLGFKKPRKSILGYEFAGVIESKGKNVKLFMIGEEVFGTTTGLKMGSYAEYVCIPEEWKSGVVVQKPVNMTFEEAAVIPIGAMTALYILKKANMGKEKKVLVYGASGSVGTYIVQLARNFGAEVTALCSTTNLEMVLSLGAQRAVDYTKKDFTKNGETYDVIIDAVGKLSSAYCKGSLKRDGIYLSTKTPTKEQTESLVFLKGLVEKGAIVPVIDKTYPLEQIADAHRYVDKGHKKGNVVISVVHGK